MEYGNHKKHSAGARNVKARAKRALLLPSYVRSDGFLIERIVRASSLRRVKLLVLTTKLRRIGRSIKKLLFRKHRAMQIGHCYCKGI